MRQLNIGKDLALQKIRHYCAYQERNHQETREKLYTYGLRTHEVEELVATLVEENYLNEERFALAYAGGKFRSKEWGRIKIKHALKQKQISDYCIRLALKSIPLDDYVITLEKIASEKNKLLRSEKNEFKRKGKLRQYLLQKGYEQDLITDALKSLKG
jgi:regulatory protein